MVAIGVERHLGTEPTRLGIGETSEISTVVCRASSYFSLEIVTCILLPWKTTGKYNLVVNRLYMITVTTTGIEAATDLGQLQRVAG